jgi:hypothetical protein
MFPTSEETAFANAAHSPPLAIEWMTDSEMEMFLSTEQSVLVNSTDVTSYDITAGTDSNVQITPTIGQTTFEIPSDLAPLDVAWMVDLLESAEQPDVIGSILDQSSLQLVPYLHAPLESTANVASKCSAGAHGGKPKR